MNKQLFECIIYHDMLNYPNQRKPKYTPEYYLTNIVDLLTDFVKWISLKNQSIITISSNTITKLLQMCIKCGLAKPTFGLAKPTFGLTKAYIKKRIMNVFKNMLLTKAINVLIYRSTVL